MEFKILAISLILHSARFWMNIFFCGLLYFTSLPQILLLMAGPLHFSISESFQSSHLTTSNLPSTSDKVIWLHFKIDVTGFKYLWSIFFIFLYQTFIICILTVKSILYIYSYFQLTTLFQWLFMNHLFINTASNAFKNSWTLPFDLSNAE